MTETEKRPLRIRDVLIVLAAYAVAAALNIAGFALLVLFPAAIVRFAIATGLPVSSNQILGAVTVMLGPLFLIRAGRSLVRELRRQLRVEAPVPPHV